MFFYHSSSGTITSPNYPANYPTDVWRYYCIRLPVISKITLYVKSFEMEYEPLCEYDWLKVLTISSLHDNALIFVLFISNMISVFVLIYNIRDSYGEFTLTTASLKMYHCEGVVRVAGAIALYTD
jgi:hypothetical protein